MRPGRGVVVRRPGEAGGEAGGRGVARPGGGGVVVRPGERSGGEAGGRGWW